MVAVAVVAAVHYGLKLYENNAFVAIAKTNLFPMSSGASKRASERAQSGARERGEPCGASE